MLTVSYVLSLRYSSKSPSSPLKNLKASIFFAEFLSTDEFSSIKIGSLFSVVAAVELVKWTRATPGFFSFFKEVNFENYKFLYLVIIVSSLLNGLLVNLILSVINTTTAISVVTVFRFAVGDFLGALAVIATLWIIFRTLIDTRLIIDPRVED